MFLTDLYPYNLLPLTNTSLSAQFHSFRYLLNQFTKLNINDVYALYWSDNGLLELFDF